MGAAEHTISSLLTSFYAMFNMFDDLTGGAVDVVWCSIARNRANAV